MEKKEEEFTEVRGRNNQMEKLTGRITEKKNITKITIKQRLSGENYLIYLSCNFFI